MKLFSVILLGVVGLGAAVCRADNIHYRKTWPPANVALDPDSIYVTGEFYGNINVNGKRVPESELALEDAITKAKKMGVPKPVLTEVCEDIHYPGVRMLYRVVNAPPPARQSTPPTRPIVLPGQVQPSP